MSRQLPFQCVILLAIGAVFSFTSRGLAEPPSSSPIGALFSAANPSDKTPRRSLPGLAANRQQVRATMAAANVDGKISKEERQTILRQAKILLPPNEVNALKQQLPRPTVKTTQKTSKRSRATPQPKKPVIRRLPAPKKRAATNRNTTNRTRPTGVLLDSETTAADKNADRPATLASLFGEDKDPAGTATVSDRADCDDYFGVCGRCDSKSCCDTGCLCDYNGWDSIKLFATVDSFKGPVDLDNRNANFGVRLGVNAGFPLVHNRGIGFQIGTAETVADFHGTHYTGSTNRWQNFTTVGIFRRNRMGVGHLSWGFAYDWLYDNYYTRLTMGQWRVKAAYQYNCDNEVGIWACLPEHGDSVYLGDIEFGYVRNRFRPLAQGSVYHKRFWDTGASTSCWVGAAEEPGEVVLGADAEIPISERLGLVGGFQYIVPSANGIPGQDEDMWYLTVGVQFIPGRCGNTGRPAEYAPFLPVADNANFSVRRF